MGQLGVLLITSILLLLFKSTPLAELKKNDILEYADFCWQPPEEWVGLASSDRFVFNNGYQESNEHWRPFVVKKQKKASPDQPLNWRQYRPSQQSLHSMFTAVSALFNYLMNEEILYGNPAQIAKKDCRYFIADAQVKEVKRLTQEQWQYVLDTAEKMADEDSVYERNLFIVASLKGLFLRISELSERTSWSPAMNHFWQDDQGNWWLKVFGKGRKLRDVSVPLGFLPYLERYRRCRGQSALPNSSDDSPIVEKLRGQGGMTSRHLTRLVQEVFDAAHERMATERGSDAADKLREASSHWLRHTGASMEIERGRALKDVSEDLGHASMATTDTVYVQSEHQRRARSGRDRKI